MPERDMSAVPTLFYRGGEYFVIGVPVVVVENKRKTIWLDSVTVNRWSGGVNVEAETIYDLGEDSFTDKVEFEQGTLVLPSGQPTAVVRPRRDEWDERFRSIEIGDVYLLDDDKNVSEKIK